MAGTCTVSTPISLMVVAVNFKLHFAGQLIIAWILSGIRISSTACLTSVASYRLKQRVETARLIFVTWVTPQISQLTLSMESHALTY